MAKKILLSIVIMFVAFVAGKNATYSQSNQTNELVELAAKMIAEQFNNKPMETNDLTISSTAQAIGKNVIYKHVNRVGIQSQQWIDERRLMIYQDLVPKVCQANSSNPAFKDGLSYTFVYVSDSGQLLAEIIVNKQVCDNQ